MDAHRFDALTRALSAASRRRLLGTLLTLPVVGGLFALLGAEDTDAKGRRKRRKKRHKHGKGNGRHRKGQRRGKCRRKSRTRICAGKCGIVKNRKTCQKKINCGPCVACSAERPCPDGCCAGDGTCQPGTATQACGDAGESCQICTDTELCDGGCQPCDVCAIGCLNTSIQQAINEANDGDTIRICAGTYQEPETIVIDRPLILLGAGQGENGTVLDGQEQHRVVRVGDGVSNVHLENLRISGGNENDGDGGGVYNGGDAILTNCTVTDNTAGEARLEDGSGGGLYNDDGARLTLVGCTVAGNRAIGGGGVFNEGGDVVLIDSAVTGNAAAFGGGGGGLFNEGLGADFARLTLTGCTVDGNTASTDGGGIINRNGGTVSLADTLVMGNAAGTGFVGGGIFDRDGGAITFTNSLVCDNDPDQCVGFSPPNGICTDACPA